MKLNNNTIVSLLVTTAATAVSAQGDDKPPASHGVAFPKPDETHVLDLRNNGGLNGLPAPLFTVRKWERGFIPYACNQAAAGQNACGAMDIEVWNVTYTDCPVPNVVCKCKNAVMQVEEFAKSLAKVPTNTRSLIRTASIFGSNGGACGGAASSGADIWIHSNCTDRQSVFIHESTHVLDCQIGQKSSSGSEWDDFYSGEKQWKDAVSFPDACVADEYAKRAWGESFAQAGVLTAYNILVSPNRLQAEFPGVGCMPSQLTVADAKLRSFFARPPGGQCTMAAKPRKLLCPSEAEANGWCSGDPVTPPAQQYPGVALMDIRQCIGFS